MNALSEEINGKSTQGK